MASRVQAKSAAGDGVSTLSVTLDLATTTGNALLVIYACYYATVPYGTISDNAGSSFTASPGDISGGFQGTLCIASAFGITGKAAGTHTVTVTPTGSATWYVMTVIEVAGITAFDIGHFHSGVGDVGLYTSGAILSATSQPDEYLLGAHAIDNLNALGAVPSTGWTIVPLQAGATEVKNSFNRMFAQERIVSASAAYASDGTADVFDSNIIACYRAASGGGSPITATLTATLAPATLAGTATAAVAASLTATLAPATLSSSASVGVAASLIATLVPATLSGAGVVGNPPIIATLIATLAPATLTSSAKVATTASLTATLAALTLAAQARVAVRAALSVTLQALVLDGNAVIEAPAPVCDTTTLTDLQTLMAQRWDGVVFWTAEEARLALNEALREWNLLTGRWRTRVTVTTTANYPEVGLPGLMTYGMRVSLRTTLALAPVAAPALIPSSVSELDLGRPSWRVETTASGGGVPTVPTVWAPLGLTRIAIWPAPTITTSLLIDGVLQTPTLVDPSDIVDLGEEIIDSVVDMALHVVAFKEGAARWRATRPYFEAFLQAAAEENGLLKTNQRFRRFAGLDRRRDLQPTTGASNQIQGVATQFSRHDQSQQGGG